MQRTFDDLGTPLRDVTFCVLDLETTGGSPQTCAITEIGAIKVRGGECLGTFQTLVNPGMVIPPEITVLTGISQAMVLPAPRIEAVLPTLAEFCAGTVIVGHNVRFDVGFLNAAYERAGWPRISHPIVDTAALARRLVRDEVPNVRLGTLASRYRLDHQPSHRALDDALATCDLLHLLLERASAFGVMGLEDLLALPKLANHPQVSKLSLTNHLPRCPGVYLFRGQRDEVLYVGKATNLRTRVRSYFSGDERRKIGNLLRETVRIDHHPTASTLEAAVLEVRLIHRHLPRYNHQSKHWGRYAYLKLTTGEAFPRLAVAKQARDDGSTYLGPITSAATAKLVAEAIETVVALRRCTKPLRKRGPRAAGLCTAAQLGVAACPCTGELAEADYAPAVAQALRALHDPADVLTRLGARMAELAGAERYEEAAAVRDRAGALARSVDRHRRIEALRRAGHLVIQLRDGTRHELRHGRLVATWHVDETPPLPLFDDTDEPDPTLPLPAHLADEVQVVAGWLDAEAHRIKVVTCDGDLALPSRPLPSFEPRGRSLAATVAR